MSNFLVHHRSPHHAENSGYGRLIDFIPAEVIYGKSRFPFQLWKFLADLHSQKSGIYDAGGILKTIELYLFLKKNRGQKNIVHFLNGERDIGYLGFLKKRFPNTFFCATFHKPPAILKKSITDTRELKKLDGAIAVGENQVSFLKEWLDLENVAYIPHGLDTNFFKPDPSLKQRNTILFVGQHLRDFKTLNNTISKLVEAISDLKVKVVLHPAYVSNIVPHPNIEIISNVSDFELLNFYQQATVLYLPMLDSTACNSLLEAMACGLPIIISNVGGNAKYLEGTNNILVEKGNEESFIYETIAILQDENRLLKMGKLSREKGLELAWSKSAKSITSFYQNLG